MSLLDSSSIDMKVRKKSSSKLIFRFPEIDKEFELGRLGTCAVELGNGPGNLVVPETILTPMIFIPRSLHVLEQLS